MVSEFGELFPGGIEVKLSEFLCQFEGLHHHSLSLVIIADLKWKRGEMEASVPLIKSVYKIKAVAYASQSIYNLYEEKLYTRLIILSWSNSPDYLTPRNMNFNPLMT